LMASEHKSDRKTLALPHYLSELHVSVHNKNVRRRFAREEVQREENNEKSKCEKEQGDRTRNIRYPLSINCERQKESLVPLKSPACVGGTERRPHLISRLSGHLSSPMWNESIGKHMLTFKY
jgi:hypothetical protein